MYDGAPIVIAQNIIEENWLDYLQAVKKNAIEEEQRAVKRQELLKEVDNDNRLGALNVDSVKRQDLPYRYYDISIHGFWNWYVNTKVEV